MRNYSILNLLKACLSLFAALITLPTHAQPLLLETYTPANGLVDTRIIKPFQDSRGRMFFLTREGFSVFDGQRFENFTEVNGVHAQLCNDAIEREDHSVDIYTFSGDIFHYQNGSVGVDTSQRQLLREFNTITRIGPGDHLYATNYKLYRKRNGRFTELKVPLKDSSWLYIDRIVLHRNYIIFNRWANTRNKTLVLYDYEKQAVTDTLPVPVNSYPVSNQQGDICFGNGQWQQLDRNALDNGQLVAKPLWFEYLIPQAFGPYVLQFDNDGFIWLSNANNVCCRINAGNGTVDYYRLSDGLLGRVHYVFRDREKNYWFIQRGKGVQKLQQSPLSGMYMLNNRPLGYVYSINNTRDGRLVVHTDKNIFNGNYTFTGSVNGFAAYWQNTYCFFNGYNNFLSFHGNSINISKEIPGYKETDFFPAFQPVEDKEGRLVIPGKMLFTVDKKNNFKGKRLPYYMDNVVIAEDNGYWCFLRSNELFHLAWKDDSLETIFSTKLPDLNPRFAVQWRPGVFAVATREKGIRFITIKDGKVVYAGAITRSNGLSNNFVYTLLRRNEHELVAGTATGLDIINITGSDTLVTRTAAGGNIFSAFNMLAQTADSVVYARTEEGLLYKLEKITVSRSDNFSHLYFSAITVNGEKQNTGDHRFNYTRNNFRFSVSYPSFIYNKNIVFIFELDGNNRAWKQQSTVADFEMNNLQPGRYTLQVTAKYPGGIYPDEKISYRFTILPPVWKRWWFILIVALIIIAAVGMMVRSYLNRKLEKQRAAFEQQQAVERERTRIATDIHDDFGAGLSRIKFISEKLLLQRRGDNTLQPELEKISGYSDEMAGKMDEIVWALNQRYDTLGDLVAFCRSYTSEYLEPYNIRLHFEENIEEQKLKGETRRNLFLVLKEALHNTVKHSGADTVHILFKTGEGKLHIQIRDNGKGLSDNIRPFANGLENMKKRVMDAGGEIIFTNDNGCVIDVYVPV